MYDQKHCLLFEDERQKYSDRSNQEQKVIFAYLHFPLTTVQGHVQWALGLVTPRASLERLPSNRRQFCHARGEASNLSEIDNYVRQ